MTNKINSIEYKLTTAKGIHLISQDSFTPKQVIDVLHPSAEPPSKISITAVDENGKKVKITITEERVIFDL
jgi:hypothetical protein